MTAFCPLGVESCQARHLPTVARIEASCAARANVFDAVATITMAPTTALHISGRIAGSGSRQIEHVA